MLRSHLTAALAARRDNDVVVDVDGWRVPIVDVDYEPQTDLIVVRLDPDELAQALYRDDEPEGDNPS